MCTVSYLPISSEDFILTSNRDESPERSPQAITNVKINGQDILYPQDTKAGGTWIAGSPGRTICLLNGAFEAHDKKAQYRHSRGSLALSYFDYPHALAFMHKFNFQGIEPFTLIVKDNSGFFEFRWDEMEVKYVKHLDDKKSHLWSSSTLYNSAVRAWRQRLFDQFITQLNSPIDEKKMIDFHQFGSPNDLENGFMMNRQERVKTVSISCIKVLGQTTNLFYQDFVHGGRDQQVVSIIF